MRGLMASVTSCIGGKDDRFAVKVKPVEQDLYFVYKSMSEFEALWTKLEALALDVKQKQQQDEVADAATRQEVSLMGKWLASFVDHYAFRATIAQLRAEEKETISTLNVLLEALVRRVSALYVENTILRCGCCPVGRQLALLVRNFLEFAQRNPRKVIDSPRQRKRQLSEMRPEDADTRKRSLPMFPIRCEGPPKVRKLSAALPEGFSLPKIHKVELSLPVVPAMPARRRVFAEVDFSI
ncbi:hypothetical protein Poli38472_000177 [Pythium oligandrum]|uniref:Uncharacterized protein n=1 Tax=Pythium oligandrum TaxID=41045 RepID=A0A8K1FE46_PYTOL|nr:hypothetical protein Poli38472_000177 [Pythium oligandrum]|eukprot:TMW60135.1 hypothetical protein Poli38472_000177 [Pythium oligandrum]